MNRVLVKITYPAHNSHQPIYTRVPEDHKEKLYAGATNKTLWLCMLCQAFGYGTSLYGQIDPNCTAHSHIIP